ncbi:hypothetical protein WN51_09041 [Melipona quadrifasciata]|uniref:Uncharacterized protein n=1 Tax=Melipona quadrifasciata TaxID=166423 RepID=A0A0M8ZN29_9HYME|nr:hypothetical protein WN51_09041 [Melipona quadrifasciata]
MRSHKRSTRDEEKEEKLVASYKAASLLKKAIRDAKANSWRQLFHQESLRYTSRPPVTTEELATAVKRMEGKKTAAGPNGIPHALDQRILHIFNGCLSTGKISEIWKNWSYFQSQETWNADI